MMARWRILARLVPVLASLAATSALLPAVALIPPAAAAVSARAAAAALPAPPAGFIAVTGCDTGDQVAGFPETPVLYVDPAWLATVPDGSVVTLHSTSSNPTGYNFYNSATNTWTGTPVADPNTVGILSASRPSRAMR
jgi:hypothetical protein